MSHIVDPPPAVQQYSDILRGPDPFRLLEGLVDDINYLFKVKSVSLPVHTKSICAKLLIDHRLSIQQYLLLPIVQAVPEGRKLLSRVLGVADYIKNDLSHALNVIMDVQSVTKVKVDRVPSWTREISFPPTVNLAVSMRRFEESAASSDEGSQHDQLDANLRDPEEDSDSDQIQFEGGLGAMVRSSPREDESLKRARDAQEDSDHRPSVRRRTETKGLSPGTNASRSTRVPAAQPSTHSEPVSKHEELKQLPQSHPVVLSKPLYHAPTHGTASTRTTVLKHVLGMKGLTPPHPLKEDPEIRDVLNSLVDIALTLQDLQKSKDALAAAFDKVQQQWVPNSLVDLNPIVQDLKKSQDALAAAFDKLKQQTVRDSAKLLNKLRPVALPVSDAALIGSSGVST